LVVLTAQVSSVEENHYTSVDEIRTELFKRKK
jgi:hypothetical protein